jgi:hypothetical protein
MLQLTPLLASCGLSALAVPSPHTLPSGTRPGNGPTNPAVGCMRPTSLALPPALARLLLALSPVPRGCPRSALSAAQHARTCPAARPCLACYRLNASSPTAWLRMPGHALPLGARAVPGHTGSTDGFSDSGGAPFLTGHLGSVGKEEIRQIRSLSTSFNGL